MSAYVRIMMLKKILLRTNRLRMGDYLDKLRKIPALNDVIVSLKAYASCFPSTRNTIHSTAMRTVNHGKAFKRNFRCNKRTLIARRNDRYLSHIVGNFIHR